MFVIHQLHPPNETGFGCNLACFRLHASFRRNLEPSRNSVWICSPYLNREDFEWAEHFGAKTVYLITSANEKREISNDPNDNPENIRRWVEVLASHTRNPVYMCVYPSIEKKYPNLCCIPNCILMSNSRWLIRAEPFLRSVLKVSLAQRYAALSAAR